MKSIFKRPPSGDRSIPLARRRCDLVVLFAVANGEWPGVADLIDSLETYLDCDYQVLALDDVSTDGTYERLLDMGLWVARNPEKCGYYGLDLTIRRAFHNAVRLFDAPIYLKIDPDALVIGPGLLGALRDVFSGSVNTGIAGTFKVDWNGVRRTWGFWEDQMKRLANDLGEPLNQALRNGYELGSSVLGGCYAVSGPCLNRIAALGYLDRWDNTHRQKGSFLAEDVCMTMLSYAAGYAAIDMGGPGQPFAIWHPGLPMGAGQLVEQRRIVAHAIKYHDDESKSVREYFRGRRQAYLDGAKS